MQIHTDSPTSGIHSALARLEASAQNVANADTPGYKRQEVRDFEAPEQKDVQMHDVFQLSKRGPLNPTDNPLDLAIDGNGAIPLKTPSGKVEFTRSASFHQDSEGRLIDKHGNQLVVDKAGERAEVGKGVSDISVAGDGLITGLNNKEDRIALGRLQAAVPVAGGGVAYTTPGTNGTGKIVSGALEGSNVNIATEMVEQIDASASLKANVASARTQDEMTGTLLNIVG